MSACTVADKGRGPARDSRAVWDRLPPGVEYTYVKWIALSVPSFLDVLPWLGSASQDGIEIFFRGKTFRALDRALQLAERPVVATEDQTDHAPLQDVAMLRHLFVQHVLRAIGDWDPHGKTRLISIRLDRATAGTGLAPGHEHPGLVIEVWNRTRRPPTPLDRTVMSPGPPPWGDARVHYYDPVLLHQLIADVVRRHFPEVMRRRIGQGWRSERDRGGWPMLTQRVIPALYDYLRPFYAFRAYRKALSVRTRGDYPNRLLDDMTDILRAELPHLASELTVARVKAAVQRYVRRAKPTRRMGTDLFRMWPPSNSA